MTTNPDMNGSVNDASALDGNATLDVNASKKQNVTSGDAISKTNTTAVDKPRGNPGKRAVKTKGNKSGMGNNTPVTQNFNKTEVQSNNVRLSSDTIEQIKKNEAIIARARYRIRVLKKDNGGDVDHDVIKPIDGFELTEPIMQLCIIFISCSCYPIHNYPGYGKNRLNDVYRKIIQSTFFTDPVNYTGSPITARDIMLLDEVQVEHYRIIRYIEQCLALASDVISQRTSNASYSALNDYVRNDLGVSDVSIFDMLVKRFDYIIERITLPFSDDVYVELNRDMAINYTIDHKRCITLGIKAFPLLIDGEIVNSYDVSLLELIAVMERVVNDEYGSESLLFQHNIIRSSKRYMAFKSANVSELQSFIHYNHNFMDPYGVILNDVSELYIADTTEREVITYLCAPVSGKGRRDLLYKTGRPIIQRVKQEITPVSVNSAVTTYTRTSYGLDDLIPSNTFIEVRYKPNYEVGALSVYMQQNSLVLISCDKVLIESQYSYPFYDLGRCTPYEIDNEIAFVNTQQL